MRFVAATLDLPPASLFGIGIGIEPSQPLDHWKQSFHQGKILLA